MLLRSNGLLPSRGTRHLKALYIYASGEMHSKNLRSRQCQLNAASVVLSRDYPGPEIEQKQAFFL